MIRPHIGNYRVVGSLGKGGMGEVFEGIHEQLGKRVAIKVLHAQWSQHENSARRFFNEARAACIIQHPGIVDIFDYGQLPSGEVYLVMEYVDGESLAARLSQSGKMAFPVAVRLGQQIASTLAVAHDKGVIHRDLKPDNIMLARDPMMPEGERIKILDFGIAKLTAQYTGAGITNTYAVMGTPAYMSPEQCHGAKGVDSQSDVYSLGIIFYEMLAGKPPFIADGVGEYITMHMAVMPQPLGEVEPHIPEGLARLVDRMLAKHPKARPSMNSVARDLNSLALVPAAIPPTVVEKPTLISAQTAPPPAAPTKRSERRKPFRVAVLGIVGSLSAIGGLWFGISYVRSRGMRTPENPPVVARKGNDTAEAPVVRPAQEAPLLIESKNRPLGEEKPPSRRRSEAPPDQPMSVETSPPRTIPAAIIK